MPDTEVFAHCFAETVGEEGGFSADPDDPGNWTGGSIGLGACRGTKFGISAASYPALDIASLSLEDAKAIYARDYWAPIQGDKLPPALAMIVFDAAVNAGVGTALDSAATGTNPDGSIWVEPPGPGQEVRVMLGWDSLPKGASIGNGFGRVIYRQCINTTGVKISHQKGSAKSLFTVTFELENPTTGLPPFRDIFPANLAS